MPLAIQNRKNVYNMQHNEDKKICFLLPDENSEGAAEIRDRTAEDTMAVTVPVKWHT